MMEFILNAAQIKEADRLTMQTQGISSIQLMERAATAWTDAFLRKLQGKKFPVDIFCGPGNNGGDGLVIARLLHRYGFSVRVIIPDCANKTSEDHQINLQRLREIKNVPVLHPSETESIPPVSDALAIDALFGTGLNRPLDECWKKWIEFINTHYFLIFSVDVPSGLPTDEPFHEKFEYVRHTHVITFESIKKTFLFPETGRDILSITVVPIGWDWTLISSGNLKERVITAHVIQQIYRKRNRFSHKGTYGKVVLLAGSEQYPGAAVLCSGGALRSGAGYVVIQAPQEVCRLVLNHHPECLSVPYFHEVPQGILLSDADALVAGPGLGMSSVTEQIVKQVIHSGVPVVLDADALNVLSENTTWLHFFSSQAILTPHPGECDRLLGKSTSHYERVLKCREAARRWNAVIILKGSYSIVCVPDGTLYYNITGNAGLAKAGSGDVLSGILGALLAQGYTATEASILGVYAHGRCAQLLAETHGMNSITASDLIKTLPNVFHEIENPDITDSSELSL